MVRRTKVNQFTEIRLILETKWGDDALVTSVHITFVYIVGYNKNIQCQIEIERKLDLLNN